MNITKQAERLEKFLDEEFSKSLPVLILPDKSIVYKQFKIKQNKQSNWTLCWVKTGDLIDTFTTKTSALLAAKFYVTGNFNRYQEIKQLDLTYWNSSVDASFFKYRLNTTKDIEKKDLYLWRYELSNGRSKQSRTKITQMFKSNF